MARGKRIHLSELSTQSGICVVRSLGVEYLDDLEAYTERELLGIYGLGRKGLNQIKALLMCAGLRLRPERRCPPARSGRRRGPPLHGVPRIAVYILLPKESVFYGAREAYPWLKARARDEFLRIHGKEPQRTYAYIAHDRFPEPMYVLRVFALGAA